MIRSWIYPFRITDKQLGTIILEVGDCRNSIFSFFLPFLAKKVVPDSRFGDARFFQDQLFDFLQKIWNGWPANHSRFFGLPDPDFQISRFLSVLF